MEKNFWLGARSISWKERNLHPLPLLTFRCRKEGRKKITVEKKIWAEEIECKKFFRRTEIPISPSSSPSLLFPFRFHFSPLSLPSLAIYVNVNVRTQPITRATLFFSFTPKNCYYSTFLSSNRDITHFLDGEMEMGENLRTKDTR